MTFLFDPGRNLLAEISLDRGCLRHLVLTAAGEREIGSFVAQWQTRGLAVPRTINLDGPEERSSATYYEYVQPRDGKFEAELNDWANRHGLCAISVEDRVIPLWEMLARLPLEASERFAFLLAIRLTPPERLVEWKSCLDEAELAWSKERQQAKKTVQQIKSKMESHLTRPFANA